jgi:DNA-binding NtrC family response regulator
MKAKFLLVDDDADILESIENRLTWMGHEVVTAMDGDVALDLIDKESPDLMLLDLEMPNMSGLDVLERLVARSHQKERGNVLLSEPVAIVMTAFATVDRAVEAMRLGAFDFLTKPFKMDYLTVVIEKALATLSLTRRVETLTGEINKSYEIVVGKSPAMQQVVDVARQAARSSATVLLLGETGTGKEVFARTIHRWSQRAAKPFMVVNCAAMPEHLLENELFGHERGAFTGASTKEIGKMEAADDGTVFLDEIGDMPPALQARLLRLLQDQEFHRIGGHQNIRTHVRFIAATNKDLRACVQKQTFRADLYFRLDVMTLTLPPLRERMDDIPELANYFLERHTVTARKRGVTLSPEAMACLSDYDWPGNVRELENVLARAVILCQDDVIEPAHLRLSSLRLHETNDMSDGAAGSAYYDALDRYSRKLIEEALDRTGWNQTKAAKALGIQRTYLTKLLRQKGISGHSPHG